jgi:hypothetical protein
MIAISTRRLASLFDWEKDPVHLSDLRGMDLKEIQFLWITVTVVLLAREQLHRRSKRIDKSKTNGNDFNSKRISMSLTIGY